MATKRKTPALLLPPAYEGWQPVGGVIQTEDVVMPRQESVEDAPRPERGSMRAIVDTGLSFGQGAVQGVRMVSDAVSAASTNPVSSGLRTVEDFIGGLKSAAAQHDAQTMGAIMQEAQDKGFGEQVAGFLRAGAVAPAQLISQALGTMAPQVAAMFIPGLREASMAARLGVGVGIGAAQGAGVGKAAIQEAVQQEGLRARMTPADATRMADEAQAWGGGNTDLIAGNMALGAAAAATGAQPIIARMLGKAAVQQAATRATMGGRALGALTGAATEAIPEGAQGGFEQYGGNVAAQRSGFDVPTMRGVAGNAALEAAMSAPIGGAFGAIDAGPVSRAASKAPAPEQAPPPVQVTPAQTQTLLDAANERARELADKAKGTKDEKIKTPEGKDVVIPGKRPEFLTPEEKAEREFLEANGGDVQALATAYPDVLEAAKTAELQADIDTAAATSAYEQREADRPELPTEEPQPGERVFTSMETAMRVLSRAGEGAEIVPVVGGVVVRQAPTSIETAPFVDTSLPPVQETPEIEQVAPQPEPVAEPATETQPDDVFAPNGKPFRDRALAARVMKQQGDGWTVAPLGGGFVVRKMAPKPPAGPDLFKGEPDASEQPVVPVDGAVAAGPADGGRADSLGGDRDVGSVPAAGRARPLDAGLPTVAESGAAAEPVAGRGTDDEALTADETARQEAQAQAAETTAPTGVAGSDAAPAAVPGAGSAAVEAGRVAEPERVKVMTRFGQNVYVNKSDLDGNKPRMRHFTSTGKSLGLIVRENLDPTGEGRAADAKEQAENPLFNVIGTKGGGVFASEAAAARERSMRGLGDSHDIAPMADGFVLKRKTTANATPPAQAATVESPAAPEGVAPEGAREKRRRLIAEREAKAAPAAEPAATNQDQRTAEPVAESPSPRDRDSGEGGVAPTRAGSAPDPTPTAQKRPPKSFRKKLKVTTSVFDEATATFKDAEVTADEALTELDTDINEMRAFLRCLRGS